MIDQTLFVRDTEGRYAVAGPNDILAAARSALARRFLQRGAQLLSPQAALEAVQFHLADREHEVFAVLFLDNQNRVLAFEELFRGTIDSAAVYPREVVKKAMAYNAAGLIMAHNHPSGVAEPSEADRHITRKLQQALELVEVRVLDHLIVGEGTYSFAEHGLI